MNLQGYTKIWKFLTKLFGWETFERKIQISLIYGTFIANIIKPVEKWISKKIALSVVEESDCCWFNVVPGATKENTIPAQSMYIVCPDSLSMVGETS